MIFFTTLFTIYFEWMLSLITEISLINHASRACKTANHASHHDVLSRVTRHASRVTRLIWSQSSLTCLHRLITMSQLTIFCRSFSKSWITIAESWHKVIFCAKHLAGNFSDYCFRTLRDQLLRFACIYQFYLNLDFDNSTKDYQFFFSSGNKLPHELSFC